MKQDRINQKWYLIAASLLVILIVGATHWYDTKKGAVVTGALWLTRWYGFLLLGVVVSLLVIGCVLLVKRSWPLERIFFGSVILLGLCYCFVLPPLSAPDEVSHYITAYKLSNQMMGKTAVSEHGLVYIRPEDFTIEDIYASTEQANEVPAVLGQTLTQETYRMIRQRQTPLQEQVSPVLSNQWAVRTTPLAYLPQAMGMTVARGLGLSSIGLLFCARIFNLVFFAAVGYLSIKRIPFGKEIVFGVGLLPMTLHLAASLSYDVMILALSFYFTAVCLDLADRQKPVSMIDIITLAAVIGILSPCKMVYAVLMGLGLLIPVQKFGGRRRFWLAIAAVAAAFTLGMVMVNYQTVATYVTETEGYVEWAQATGYSFGYLLHNPRVVLRMFYQTLLLQAESYHLNMIGSSLGNMDPVLNVPYLFVQTLTVCLVLLALKKPQEQQKLGTNQRCWIWCLCLAGSMAIFFSMLLAWTPVGAASIQGVQGRYFLPFLPILLISIKNDWLVLTKNVDRTILYVMCCVNGYVVLRLFSIVSMRI